HRLPLEVHGRLQAEFNDGRAVLVRGRVTAVERDGESFKLMTTRHGATQAEVTGRSPAWACRAAERPSFEQERRADAWPIRAWAALPGVAMGNHRGAGDRAPVRPSGREHCGAGPRDDSQNGALRLVPAKAGFPGIARKVNVPSPEKATKLKDFQRR